MKSIRTWTKFFLLLTGALFLIYLIGTFVVEEYEAVWLVPELYVLYGAIASAIVSLICYVRKK
jgi:hypothetical protein